MMSYPQWVEEGPHCFDFLRTNTVTEVRVDPLDEKAIGCVAFRFSDDSCLVLSGNFEAWRYSTLDRNKGEMLADSLRGFGLPKTQREHTRWRELLRKGLYQRIRR